MPEGRSFPWKYLPRRAVPISVTFGEPLSHGEIQNALASMTSKCTTEKDTATVVPSQPSEMETKLCSIDLDRYDPAQEENSREIASRGWLGNIFDLKYGYSTEEPRGLQTARIRSQITAVIQKEVEKLGRSVLGSNT